MPRAISASAQVARDPADKDVDIAAVRAIAQAAIDVELFTIPLYMTALYSIEGYRENNSAPPAAPLPPLPHGPLYKGRLWPGASTTAGLLCQDPPMPPNQQAYNILFSILIEEMLHLQMAANMASSIGVAPSFTSAALQTPSHGWLCYGPTNSLIPHIVDLTDTDLETPGSPTLKVPVNVGPLDQTRVQLFLAIEQDEQAAIASLGPNAPKYEFPWPIPGWTPTQPLPLFGTIGNLYRFYWDYLNATYTDGSTLWDAVYVPCALGAGQQDYFNCGKGTQPEYPRVGLHVGELLCGLSPLEQMGAMIDAITDQGEGSVTTGGEPPSPDVLEQYQADRAALEANYPSYNSDGGQIASADASARCLDDLTDHYARFQQIQTLLGGVTTWASAGKAGNWTAADLTNSEYDPANPYGLPEPAEMAAAMNMMASADQAPTYFPMLSQAVVADIAAVTTTLNEYWSESADPTISFPQPSMSQSGDRMSTVWATFGQAPDLSIGVPAIPAGLNHSCQGLSIAEQGANTCARVELFHGCIGTNSCMALGGCGFPHTCSKGGGCGASVASAASVAGGCSAAAGSGTGGASGGSGKCGTPGEAGKCGAVAGTGKCGAPAGGGKCGAVAGTGKCGAPAEGGKCGTPAGTGKCGAPAQGSGAKCGGGCGGKAGGVEGGEAAGTGKCGAPAEGGGVKCGGGCGAKSGAVKGGGNMAAGARASVKGGCTPGVLTSAPGDNKCAGFGGCGVPISAYQLYAKGGEMQLFDFQPESDPSPVWIGSLTFNPGDRVSDIAYQAFSKVMENRHQSPPAQQPPSPLRLVFPPTT